MAGTSSATSEHDLAREGEPFATTTLPLSEVTCDRLVLSAGTLGTTYLLLAKPATACPA